jgi:hypothetical protein
MEPSGPWKGNIQSTSSAKLAYLYIQIDEISWDMKQAANGVFASPYYGSDGVYEFYLIYIATIFYDVH